MNDFFTKHRHTIALGAILLAGLLLRLWRLGSESLWEDEALDYWLSYPNLKDLLYAVREQTRGGLPLHYLITSWVKLIGQTEWLLRLPAVIFSVGSIALTYLVSRRIYLQDRFTPLLATALMAFSALQIHYAQENRFYSLLVFLSLLLWWLLLWAVQVGKTSNWWAYGLVAIISSYAHYYSFFILGSQILYLAITQLYFEKGTLKNRVQPLVAAISVFILSVICFLPGILLFTSNAGQYGEFSFRADQLLGIAKVMAASLWPGVVVIVAIPCIWGNEKARSIALVAAGLFTLICILTLDWATGYFYHLRQIIFIQPLFLILLARGVDQMIKTIADYFQRKSCDYIYAMVGLIFIGIVSLPMLWAYYTQNPMIGFAHRKPQWDQIIKTYGVKSSSRSAILCWQSWDRYNVRYYLQQNHLLDKQPVIDLQGDIRALQRIAKEPFYDEYWFVDNGDYDQVRTKLTVGEKTWLDQHLSEIDSGYEVRLTKLITTANPRPVKLVDFKSKDYRSFIGPGWNYSLQKDLRREVKSRNRIILKVKRGLQNLIYPYKLDERYYLPNAQEVVWSSGKQSVLIIPVKDKLPKRMRLRIAAPKPMTAAFALNHGELQRLDVSTQWAEYEVDLTSAQWRQGNNRIVITYPDHHSTSERDFTVIWDWCEFEY